MLLLVNKKVKPNGKVRFYKRIQKKIFNHAEITHEGDYTIVSSTEGKFRARLSPVTQAELDDDTIPDPVFWEQFA